MLLPNRTHGVEGNAFGFRQEEGNENGHVRDPSSVEQEGAIFEVAKHGQEGLGKHEGGGEVDSDADALARGSDFDGEYFTWNEPTERTPRPTKPSCVDAH